MLQDPVATLVDERELLVTGPANFGPAIATSAVAAFGPAGAMFVTVKVSGKFPFR